MSQFQPHINPIYPPKNFVIFEEWFWECYKGCNTDREPIPVFFTSYLVNNNYAQDLKAKQELQEFIDSLDRSKKWFTLPIQYDDGAVIDFKDLNVLQFNMSKMDGIMLPLICQPHDVRYDKPKKYIASFIGSLTHPIRNRMIESLSGKSGYYISTEPHDYDRYNQIISESMFCLSPRGYGAASFRCYCEAVYQNSIPVYLSDTHIIPFELDFNDFGVLVNEEDIGGIDEILMAIEPEEIIRKQNNLPLYYDKYFSYSGAMQQIIKILEKESASKT